MFTELLCPAGLWGEGTHVTDRTTEGTLIVLAPNVPLGGAQGEDDREASV